MAYSLGSKQWLEHTGGKLGLRDRLALIYQGVIARAVTKKKLKAGGKFRYIEVDDILPPDSPICMEAMALSEGVSHPYLFNHCIRSYFWARLMNGCHSFDDEVTFTALMLHDLGLTDKYRLQGNSEQCFTLPAAKVAEQMAIRHHWSEKRVDLVTNAITLHLNVTMAKKHGREAELVRMGSGADVAGLGLSFLHREQVEQVVTRLPRLDLKKNIKRDLKIEVEQRPCCRIAFLTKQLGFNRLVDQSLFDE